MTPAGEKWAIEIYPGDLRRKSVPDMAEFWLRAFCDEVERRGKYGDRPLAISASFEELKRELLGDS